MKRPPTHPGDVLRDELEARGPSAGRLALALRVPVSRIAGIANGTRSIGAETARRLAACFGTDARFRVNPQTQYDLAVTEQKLAGTIRREVDAALARNVTPQVHRQRGYMRKLS